MGSSAKGDDKFITTDYLQQCRICYSKMACRVVTGGTQSAFIRTRTSRRRSSRRRTIRSHQSTPAE
ncbi:hypothetical protein E6D16_23360 [Escherichia coli]|nr:hypothetical protein [Escherichia coli]